MAAAFGRAGGGGLEVDRLTSGRRAVKFWTAVREQECVNVRQVEMRMVFLNMKTSQGFHFVSLLTVAIRESPVINELSILLDA